MKNLTKKYMLALIVMSVPVQYVVGGELSYAKQIIEVETSPKVLEAFATVKNIVAHTSQMKNKDSINNNEVLKKLIAEVLAPDQVDSKAFLVKIKKMSERRQAMSVLLTNNQMPLCGEIVEGVDLFLCYQTITFGLIFEISEFFKQVESLNSELKNINEYNLMKKYDLLKKESNQREKLVQLVGIMKTEWRALIDALPEMYFFEASLSRKINPNIEYISFKDFENNICIDAGAFMTVAQYLLEQRDMLMEKILVL